VDSEGTTTKIFLVNLASTTASGDAGTIQIPLTYLAIAAILAVIAVIGASVYLLRKRKQHSAAEKPATENKAEQKS